MAEPAVCRVQQKESTAKEESFVSLTPFAELLDYHDPTKHTFSDNAQVLGNAVKLIASTVVNTASKKGKIAFGPSR